MTRSRAIGYAAITAWEVGYLLRNNLPSLLPPPPCGERRFDVCVLIHPFPWPWIALTSLLLLSAVAIILRKRVGILAGFVAQGFFFLPFLLDTDNEVGSFLFTGSGYDAVDPSYRDLAFIILAISVAVGPAFTLLLLMVSRRVEITPRPARAAGGLLGLQVVILMVVAVVVFRATLHDCEFYGGNPPMVDGVPWCTPSAEIDLAPVLAVTLPSAAVMLLVAAGAWRARAWAVAGGVVWQVMLAAILAVMGMALWTEQSQNAWYDHLPAWTSPRDLAYILMLVFPTPTLVALFAARGRRADGQSESWSGGRGPEPGALRG